MNFRFLCTIFLSVLLLQGCVGAVVVGTAAVATKTTTDPRTTGTQVDDTTLEMRVSSAMAKDLQLKQDARIIIVAYQGQILLIGQAPSSDLSSKAQQIAAQIDGVQDIYNEIRLGQPIGISRVSQDSWITTKIRSKLLTSDQVKSTNVKVITENGEVFLLGLVTDKQAQSTAQIASQTSGVQKVTTVFNYVR
jgi:osmotically-inducible protein OsmY